MTKKEKKLTENLAWEENQSRWHKHRAGQLDGCVAALQVERDAARADANVWQAEANRRTPDRKMAAMLFAVAGALLFLFGVTFPNQGSSAFPDFPVLPIVSIVGLAALATSILILKQETDDSPLPFFKGVAIVILVFVVGAKVFDAVNRAAERRVLKTYDLTTWNGQTLSLPPDASPTRNDALTFTKTTSTDSVQMTTLESQPGNDVEVRPGDTVTFRDGVSVSCALPKKK